jgi:hypothetical protein
MSSTSETMYTNKPAEVPIKGTMLGGSAAPALAPEVTVGEVRYWQQLSEHLDRDEVLDFCLVMALCHEVRTTRPSRCNFHPLPQLKPCACDLRRIELAISPTH